MKTNTFKRHTLATVFILFFSVFTLVAADFPEEVNAAKQDITGKMIVSHIDFLASKYCRGRETGDLGMFVADKYITSVLGGTGVTPAGDYGSFFQRVRLKTTELSENISLKVQEGNLYTTAKLQWDYLPLDISAQKAVNAPLVFAGYGITAPEYNYDDYKNINVNGKIVLVIRDEPGVNDEKSPFKGQKLTGHGTFLTKILNAQKHGAVGILFVSGPLTNDDTSLRSGGYMSGTRWPSIRKKNAVKDEDFKFRSFKPRMRIVGDDFGVLIPAVLVDGAFAQSLMGSANDLKKIQQSLDKNFKARSFNTGKKIAMNIVFDIKPVRANNIVFKVEGSDPVLKDEIVMVGAHYDHVGKNKRGQVHPGADDNASGSAVVMELARAFESLELKPKRTLLFILFTAEEKGLLGARYYVQNPLFPLEKTIAMFNLDMLGRNDAGQISVLGKYQYPKLFKIVDDINKQTVNFDINFNIDSVIRNSDHFPFMRYKVPALFFNSGMHDELHTPRDSVDLIIPDKIEKAAQLVFLSMWNTANLPAGTELKK